MVVVVVSAAFFVKVQFMEYSAYVLSGTYVRTSLSPSFNAEGRVTDTVPLAVALFSKLGSDRPFRVTLG